MSALPRPPARSSTTAGLRVRGMRRGDLDAVAAIEREIYPFPWSRGNFTDSLSSGYDAWVFEGGDEIGTALLGYAVVMWIPDEAHLLNLSVGRTRRAGASGGRCSTGWCATRRAAGHAA